MWKCATLLVLCALASPAFATKLLSIEQIEQLLFKLQGKPDGKVAAELGDVQLTERVSPARLARWETEFPGSRAHEEMMRLADLSAFQNPPVDDVLRDPEPDAKTQVQILTLAAKYVRATLARLPDFFATRDTTHFESLIAQREDYSVESSEAGGRMDANGSLRSLSLKRSGIDSITEIDAVHSAGQYSATVTYRDGHEVPAGYTEKQKKEPNLGLTSSGEFGPVLAEVVGDALQSKIDWLRWEQGAGEPEAVFQFSVPASKSHFSVSITEGGQTVTLIPAYHGEIEIDPATGEILRLSKIAEMAPPRDDLRAAIMVEFAPVIIAGRSYTCPIRSVALSRLPAANTAPGPVVPLQTKLNDVAFTDYHEFRSDVSILANNGANGNAGASAANATPAAETAANAPPPSAAPPPAEETPASNAAPAAAAQPASAPASNQAPTPNSATASAAPAEASAMPAANSVPAPAGPEASAEPPAAGAASATLPEGPHASVGTTTGALASDTVLRSNAQLVLVDVAVTNHDRPVEGLSRDRFHVFEDGHEQPLASFEEFAPAAKVTVAEPPALPPNTYSNVPTYPDTGAVNVLLLDALNTPASDQEQVRRAMIGYLGSIKPGTPLAIFTLSSRLRMAAGFTTDGASLLKVLESQKGKPGAAAGVGSGQGADMSTDLKQAASGINTSSDPGTIWLVTQIMQFAADMNTYDADQSETMTIDAFSELARYLAAIPGRKNVIWFSGSFPIGIGTNAGVRTPLKDMRNYSGALEKMSELLAAARVAVYPVDARGLMMAPTSSATYIPPPAFPSPGNPLQGDAAATAGNRDNKTFEAQTSQEKGTMDTIASQTGGHVYSTGNDLKAAIEKIMANDSYYYALSYVPPQRKDGGDPFHTVEVKVDGGYQLAYRRGYYAGAPAAAAAGNGNAPAPMLAAAVLGAPPSTQILFTARVQPQSDGPANPPAHGPALAAGPASAASGPAGADTGALKAGDHRYGLDLGVNPQTLTFTESADGARRARVQCAVVAYDGAGKELNSLSRIFDINLPQAKWAQFKAAGTNVVFLPLTLDLPPAAAFVRIVVYDTASASTGSLEIPLEVSAGAAP
jgi:VWFA-related protein